MAVWRELALREKCCLTALPEDVLQYIVGRIPLAHHIARKAPTCRVISVAVRNALKARAILHRGRDAAAHGRWNAWRRCPTAASSPARSTTPSRCGATARASAPSRRTKAVWAVAVLPGGARRQRLGRRTAKLWTLDGASSAPSTWAPCSMSRRCPTACTLWSALATRNEVRLYHVDGTPVHTFKGHPLGGAVAVTTDGQHIISGSDDKLVKVWSVASRSP